MMASQGRLPERDGLRSIGVNYRLALAASSSFVARTLRVSPTALTWYLRKAKDHVDWRCDDPILCRTGFGARMHCRLTDTIQRKIAYFGTWEPNLTAYFRRALRPGDVLADVGANIGYYSLLGSSLVGPSGQVVAVEASPVIYDLLLTNLDMNLSANVRAVNCAASYEAGELPVYTAPSNNIGHSSTVPQEGNVCTGMVQASALHDILTTDELSKARLIKIDIEGAEGPVVKSILENIERYGAQCEIAVEVAAESACLLDEMHRRGFYPYLVENEYRDAPYIRGDRKPPTRFTGTITTQSDFIFSRVDQGQL